MNMCETCPNRFLRTLPVGIPSDTPVRLVLVANAGLDLNGYRDGEEGEQMWGAAVHDLADVLSPEHPVVRRLRARERLEIDVEPPPL
jgi:hypothetical protein